MANVPGLNVGGTGTSAVQSQGAIPVVASGGKAFAFSAVGTSGYFLRSGGTGVPTFFNLLGTGNVWDGRQDFTFGIEGIRLKSNGSSNRAYMGLYKLDAGLSTRTGYIGHAQSTTGELDIVNEIAGEDLILSTDNGNIHLRHAAFSPGGGTASGVIAVQNCVSPPTGDPSGGAFWYVQGGASKARGSSGTIMTFGPAEPHCVTCGGDFVLEWENAERQERTAVCVPCFIGEVHTLLPLLNRAKFEVPRP
jgi:hypothetical protein